VVGDQGDLALKSGLRDARLSTKSAGGMRSRILAPTGADPGRRVAAGMKRDVVCMLETTGHTRWVGSCVRYHTGLAYGR
jgi:hypothetical protein